MKRNREQEYKAREIRRKSDPLFVAKEIYQKHRSRSKTHKYKELHYSVDQFIEWLSNTNYELMFKAWVESGNKKELKPSIDRVDPKKGYRLDNIQLMTWEENNIKGRYENSTTKKVIQYSKDGKFIAEWGSAVEASRSIAPNIKNHNKSKIYEVLNNKPNYNTFHGFKFKYKEAH